MREPSARTSRLAIAAGLAAFIAIGAGGFLLGRATAPKAPPPAPAPVVAAPTPPMPAVNAPAIEDPFKGATGQPAEEEKPVEKTEKPVKKKKKK